MIGSTPQADSTKKTPSRQIDHDEIITRIACSESACSNHSATCAWHRWHTDGKSTTGLILLLLPSIEVMRNDALIFLGAQILQDRNPCVVIQQHLTGSMLVTNKELASDEIRILYLWSMFSITKKMSNICIHVHFCRNVKIKIKWKFYYKTCVNYNDPETFKII